MPRQKLTARKSTGGRIPRYPLAARTPQLPTHMLPSRVAALEEEVAEWKNQNEELDSEEAQDKEQSCQRRSKHQQRMAELDSDDQRFKGIILENNTELQNWNNKVERWDEQTSRVESRVRRSSSQLHNLHHYIHQQHIENANESHQIQHAQHLRQVLLTANQQLFNENVQLLEHIQGLQPPPASPEPPMVDGSDQSGVDSVSGSNAG